MMVLICLLTIQASGTSEAFAQEAPELGACNDRGECLITKKAAAACKANSQKAARFDDLATECGKVKKQKAQLQADLNVRTGERNEARRQGRTQEMRASEWEAKARLAQKHLDEKWSPFTWMAIGSGITIATGAIIFALIPNRDGA